MSPLFSSHLSVRLDMNKPPAASLSSAFTGRGRFTTVKRMLFPIFLAIYGLAVFESVFKPKAELVHCRYYTVTSVNSSIVNISLD